MAGWNSSVDSALGALVDMLRAALPDVTVTDGPAVVDIALSQLLTVGYQANSSEDLAVDVQTSSEGWAGSPQRETYEVYCSASAFVGDDDQSLARAPAFAIYGAACEAIRADPTLGGAVMRTVPGGWALHQSASGQGRAATISFSVIVDAYTT